MLTVYAKDRMKQNTVPVSYTASCSQCCAVAINGRLAHETGCPEAWRDYKRKCSWCDSEFDPETSDQKCCSVECYNSFYN